MVSVHNLHNRALSADIYARSASSSQKSRGLFYLCNCILDNRGNCNNGKGKSHFYNVTYPHQIVV